MQFDPLTLPSLAQCANTHNWNIFPHLGQKQFSHRNRMGKFIVAAGERVGGSLGGRNESCLHKYLYLFAHLQFCMNSDHYAS